MILGRRVKKKRKYELDPDEIFLDSSNLSGFDQSRLEGKFEKPIEPSTFTGIGFVAILMFMALMMQAASLQILQGSEYAERSERNRLRPQVLFAERGAIVDRNGNALVYNEEGHDGFVRRVYEYPGFSHLLGYVSYPKRDSSGNFYETVIKGLNGVEEAMDDVLSGENGTLLVEENAHGALQSSGTVKPAEKGETVTLSIDARAQRAFASSIQELADRIPFLGGSAILMDVNTGEVHALVSYPEYDPNVLSSGGPSSVIASYQTNPRRVYLDRAVSGLYTPGSIIKPMEVAGALSDGVVTADWSIVSTGSISIPNPYDPSRPSIFKDWKAHGRVDARRAVAVSSDVYFYAIGGGYREVKGLGIERLKYWYDAFGFTSPTGIELSGEATGFVPTPAWKEERFGDPWRLGDTYNTAIGQYAMQITPLAAARGTAAVANGGKLVKPTLVKDAPLQGQTIPISQAAIRVAQEGMRMTTTEGTAIGLNDLSFVKVAAKTGTAQLGVNNEFYNSWAIGYFPYDKPKYAFVVVMERGPSTNSIGGIFATHTALTRLYQTAPEYFE
ncbi:MAG: penicillin-binding transpeptidase domain-containing protein [bacterium]|nr:penicillin-binding transpeptidase domain-containing protein [bacterium]